MGKGSNLNVYVFSVVHDATPRLSTSLHLMLFCTHLFVFMSKPVSISPKNLSYIRIIVRYNGSQCSDDDGSASTCASRWPFNQLSTRSARSFDEINNCAWKTLKILYISITHPKFTKKKSNFHFVLCLCINRALRRTTKNTLKRDGPKTKIHSVAVKKVKSPWFFSNTNHQFIRHQPIIHSTKEIALVNITQYLCLIHLCLTKSCWEASVDRILNQNFNRL